MKEKFAFLLSSGLAAAVGTIWNSWAPTQTLEGDTTRLTVTPSSLILARSDSLQESSVTISCPCCFAPLVTTRYGWDTSIIHFSFKEARTDTISLHTVTVRIRVVLYFLCCPGPVICNFQKTIKNAQSCSNSAKKGANRGAART